MTALLPRRTLLKAGVLGAAAGFAPRASAQAAPPGDDIPVRLTGRPEPVLDEPLPQPQTERLGWAVCGVGHFAQNHVVPGIAGSRRAKLAALISGSADNARRVGAGYGVGPDRVYGYEDWDRIARDESIDVVYVVTPNALHEEPVIRAFEAGKHVMCEKPMATTSKACQRMIDAGRAADRKLMVAYRAHFEPHNVEAKRLMDEGELGEVWFATSDHHRPLNPDHPRDQWRARKDLAGGGSLPDIGIYAFNGIVYFFGEEPSRVRAVLASPPNDPRFAEVEAFCQAEMAFPSGRTAQFSSGYTGDKKRIDLIGSEATITLDPATNYTGNRLSVITEQASRMVDPSRTSDTQFAAEIDHLCQAIQEGTEILTPGEMGLRDVRLIEAFYRSAQAGGGWVEIG